MLPHNAVNVIWPGILCFVSLDTTERLIAYIKHLAHYYIQNANLWQDAALCGQIHEIIAVQRQRSTVLTPFFTLFYSL